jgi:sugar/nucleoside kinase (ribokinase family)
MNKEFDVIVVGELNVDLILNQIESFPEMGKEKIAHAMTLTLGSSSAIFASNLSSLGAKVSFIGKIGEDSFGDLILDSLRTKKVDTSMILKSGKLNSGVTIVLNYGENRAMVTYQGAMNELTFADINSDNLKKAKHLHFSSYYLQPGMRTDIEKLFKLAKEHGLTTSFDMQWDPEEKWELDYKEVLPHVDIFLPNEAEIKNLTGTDDVDEALEKLKDYANLVCVKMGSKGSLLHTKDEKIYKEAFVNENVVDAIGAGDSFNAGFIYKFIEGADLSICQEFGNLMGAVNTTEAGGTSAFTDYDHVIKIAKNKFGYSE